MGRSLLSWLHSFDPGRRNSRFHFVGRCHQHVYQRAALFLPSGKQLPKGTVVGHKPQHACRKPSWSGVQPRLSRWIKLISQPLNQGEAFLQPSCNGQRLAPGGTVSAPHSCDGHTLKSDTHGNMAAKPEEHVRFKHRRQTGIIEKVDPSLVVHLGLLPSNTYSCIQLAARVDAPLYKGHSERTTISSNSISQLFGIEGVAQELYLLGCATLKCR